MTQRLQLVVQNRVIAAALAETGALEPPLLLRLIAATPWLRRLLARLIGLGLRPEHVLAALRTPT